MAQYTTDRQTLGSLLSTSESGERIVVPEWQRSYSWGTEEARAFWDDLTAFSEGYPGDNILGHEYFLGSIVLVDRTYQLELLDGQQRLATATILLSVIRDYLTQFRDDAGIATARDYIVRESFTTSTLSYRLQLARYDADFFRREIQDKREGNDQIPTASLLSHKRIRAVRSYFDSEFKMKYESLGGGESSYRWALRIQRVLTDHLSLVEVRSYDEDSAAEVFETLNSRGISLSTTDLLRNLLMRRSEEQQRDEINDLWEHIFQLERNVEEFLRHWWLSAYGDLKGSSLYKALKPKITPAELTPIGLTRQLEDSAQIYRSLLDCQDQDQEVVALLHDVKDLGAKVFYPLLLNVFRPSGHYYAKRKHMLRSLLALFVRYNVIGGMESTELEKAVYALAREISADTQVDYMDRIQRLAPDDESFERSFQTAQVTRQATAKYLLREIEKSRRSTSELVVQGGRQVHVEHIYPKSPEDGQEWEDHEDALHRIGNLTLLSGAINQSLSNKSFEVKKPRYETSELKITKELVDYADWNQQTISARQGKLAAEALTIWAFSSQV